MKSLVLDTHAVLWFLDGDAKLPKSMRSLIEDPDVDLYLPALVVSELVNFICKGRTRLDFVELQSALYPESRLVVVAMSKEIALATSTLISLSDIHDRCIVATAMQLIKSGHDAVLMTRDKAIRDSGFVPTIWELSITASD